MKANKMMTGLTLGDENYSSWYKTHPSTDAFPIYALINIAVPAAVMVTAVLPKVFEQLKDEKVIDPKESKERKEEAEKRKVLYVRWGGDKDLAERAETMGKDAAKKFTKGEASRLIPQLFARVSQECVIALSNIREGYGLARDIFDRLLVMMSKGLVLLALYGFADADHSKIIKDWAEGTEFCKDLKLYIDNEVRGAGYNDFDALASEIMSLVHNNDGWLLETGKDPLTRSYYKTILLKLDMSSDSLKTMLVGMPSEAIGGGSSRHHRHRE